MYFVFGMVWLDLGQCILYYREILRKIAARMAMSATPLVGLALRDQSIYGLWIYDYYDICPRINSYNCEIIRRVVLTGSAPRETKLWSLHLFSELLASSLLTQLPLWQAAQFFFWKAWIWTTFCEKYKLEPELIKKSKNFTRFIENTNLNRSLWKA